MAQIRVEGLVKTYQIAERAPGLWGAIRGLARRKTRTVRALAAACCSRARSRCSTG